jgi:RNA-directed DNA polymerase
MYSEEREEHRTKCSGSQASVINSSAEHFSNLTMSDVLERNNLLVALKKVRSNKGCPGMDGMTVDELIPFLKEKWITIKEQLLLGTYKPNPVKVIYIPKKNGSKRMLGIPCVIDRLIQQAIAQKLSEIFDPTFSESSYGFRPRRSALQAISKAREYQKQGYLIAVDLDLEKFFDQVNHDILMNFIAKKIQDKQILIVIRKYLQAGLMNEGIIQRREMGTPQGSPLSPLLSNILLNCLDKELEKRGHKFCRYADDLITFVKSEKAGKRVYSSITTFITKTLKLKVNHEKSKVTPAWKCNFLGYSFLGMKEPKIRCSNESTKAFKENVKRLTRGHAREGIEKKISNLNTYIRGWAGYFRLVETSKKLQELDGWIRSRLRMCLMKQWFFPRTRIRNLIKVGMPIEDARGYGKHKRWWYYAQLHHTRFYLNNGFWEEKGFKGIMWNFKKFGKV